LSEERVGFSEFWFCPTKDPGKRAKNINTALRERAKAWRIE
jgi:hypothetical protein